MARSKEVWLGYLRGQTADGAEAMVRVSKIGRDFRIGYGDRSHLCHPSVRNIEAAKRETFLVFHVRASEFLPHS